MTPPLHPLFILEGPDCVGKTTLARRLAYRLNGVYWHMTCTRLLAPAMTDYQLNAVANARQNLEHRPVVLDRLWPSEHCYGKVLRPETMIDVQPIRDAVLPLDPVYIFCEDMIGAEHAADRHAQNLDEAHPYKREQYLAIYRNYHALRQEMQAGYPGIRPDVVVRPFDSKITTQAEVLAYNDAWIDGFLNKFSNRLI